MAQRGETPSMDLDEPTNSGSQPKGSRVTVYLDGDNDIFAVPLMEKRFSGGHEAAEGLTDAIKKYLQTENVQIWIKLFFDKQGVLRTLRCNTVTQSVTGVVHDFYAGFSQASKRIVVADCGGAKEAADSKIRAHLEDDLNNPTTLKVILGGCHDTGYLPDLHTHKTDGHQDKLLLLKTRNFLQIMEERTKLPVIDVSSLFIQDTLESPPTASSRRGSVASRPSSSLAFNLPTPDTNDMPSPRMHSRDI